MTPTKLSDSDKAEIVSLYRQTDENTITLSERYGVSSSTIRRVLQSHLSDEEYDALVQQKQKRPPRVHNLTTTPKTTRQSSKARLSESLESEDLESSLTLSTHSVVESGKSPSPLSVSGETKVSSRTRKRSSSVSLSDNPTDFPLAHSPEPALVLSLGDKSEISPDILPQIKKTSSSFGGIFSANDILAEDDFVDFEGEEGEEDEEDDLEEDYEDQEFGEEDYYFSNEGFTRTSEFQLRGQALIQVLPLSEAALPKICYLVVDRSSELITRPLKAFADLGQIPPEEVWEKTLPVFDNHRVARRFSARHQRICKIPDGRLLQKTAPYLQSKGITRLLVDGQVYSVEN